MGQEDTIFIVLILIVFALSLAAQSRVQNVFRRYADTPAASGKTGSRIARELLAAKGSAAREEHDEMGRAARVESITGHLTDHYDPRTHVVRLSPEVANGTSVSAAAIAAHEVAHVLQYEEEYLPIKLRGAILPVAQIGSQAGPILVFVGLIFSLTPILALVGVGLYTFAVLFQVATLPVELNASRRAMKLLADGGYISREQEPQARKMLRAAASTYVLAALASFVTLLRLIMLSRRRR